MQKLVDYLINQAIEAEVIRGEQEEILRYGLVMGINFAVGLLAIVSTGILLGHLPQILLAAAVGVGLRLVSGGAHFSSSFLCLAYTLFALLVATSVGEFLTERILLLPIHLQWFVVLGSCLLFLSIGLWVVDRYVPVDNPNRPITNRLERQRFRLLSYAFVLFIAVLYVGLVLFCTRWCYALPILLISFMQLFSLTKFGGQVFLSVNSGFLILSRNLKEVRGDEKNIP